MWANNEAYLSWMATPIGGVLLASAEPHGGAAALGMWPVLRDMLLLLVAAVVLGALFERVRQSAIMGYLLAGTLLGPYAMNWVAEEATIATIAELGVSLLLFSIGLEFSIAKLRRFGRTPWIIGGMQVGLTLLLGALVAGLCGLSVGASVAVGAVLSLSSTALVARSLSDRAELDAVHGRQAMGVLIFQDIAVVPLVLIVEAMGTLARAGAGPGATAESGEVVTEAGAATPSGWALAGEVVGTLFVELLLAAVLVFAFYGFARYVLPLMIRGGSMSRNRELPVLFAVVSFLAGSYLANALGVSAALGAFIAGVMIGESPVAAQVRADVGALKTLFLTLFFGAIGMLADLVWVRDHLLTVLLVLVVVLAGKTAVVALAGLMVKLRPRHAVAAGLAVAQVGEFSFVLIQAAAPGTGNGVLSPYTTNLLLAVTIATLFATPALIARSVPWGRWVERRWPAGGGRHRSAGSGAGGQTWQGAGVEGAAGSVAGDGDGDGDHEDGDGQSSGGAAPPSVLVIGFGPAGQEAATAAAKRGWRVTVLDLNPASYELARSRGYHAELGDVQSTEMLEHVGVARASAVVITLPDYRAALTCIENVRRCASAAPLIVRARYHRYAPLLEAAGAMAVADEEVSVGERLAEALLTAIDPSGAGVVAQGGDVPKRAEGGSGATSASNAGDGTGSA